MLLVLLYLLSQILPSQILPSQILASQINKVGSPACVTCSESTYFQQQYSIKARPAASGLVKSKLLSRSLHCYLEANSVLGLQVAQSYGLLLGTIVMVPKTAQTLAAIIMLTFILTGGYFVRGDHSYMHSARSLACLCSFAHLCEENLSSSSMSCPLGLTTCTSE